MKSVWIAALAERCRIFLDERDSSLAKPDHSICFSSTVFLAHAIFLVSSKSYGYRHVKHMTVSIGHRQRFLLLYFHSRNFTRNQDFFLLRFFMAMRLTRCRESRRHDNDGCHWTKSLARRLETSVWNGKHTELTLLQKKLHAQRFSRAKIAVPPRPHRYLARGEQGYEVSAHVVHTRQ